MSAKYKSPSFLLPNELNTSANTANDTGVNSLYSMDFDSSSSDYIDIGTTPNTADISISFWVKHSTGGTVTIASGDGVFEYLRFFAGQSQVSIFIANQKYDLTTNIKDGNWHHVVVTNDTSANEIKGYTDGSLTATHSLSVSTNNVQTIGVYKNKSLWFFNGSIDEVAIFNRALDSTEISALYGGTSPNIYPSNLIASNLNPIAYYPLGEQAQNTGYLTQEVTNGWQFPNGVLQDYVMDFDGTDFIDCGSVSLNSNTGTVSAWIKTSYTSDLQIIAAIDSFPFMQLQLRVQNTGVIRLLLSNGSTFESLDTTATVNDGNWHHVAFTYSSSGMNIYIDGSLNVSNTDNATPLTTATGNFLIGARSLSGTLSKYFNGKISNVAIWNTDQSANIANIYNNGSPQTNYTVTPQNWWKLNADSVYTPSAPNYTTSLNFSGSGNRVNFNPINLSGNKTVSYWLKPLGAGLIVAGQNYKYYSYYNSSTIVMRDSSGISSWPSLSLDNTKWYHFCITGDGTNATLYVNGESKGSQPDRSPTVDTIGAYTSGFDGFFNGNVSNLAIYNVILTASQVSTLFNFGTPETNISFSPQAWWKLDNQTAITDSSGNGNTGTNNGAVNSPGGVAVVPSWKIPSALPITTPNYTTALDFVPNDYIDCGTGLGDTLGTYTGDLTFSIWFNADTVNPANDGIFYIGDFNSQGALQVNIYNNNIIFRANGGGGSKQFSFTDTTSWHNLTCVYLAGDRANSKLYLDGVLQTTSDGGSFPSSLSLTGLKTIIGSYYNSTFNFDGKLSNFQIFNTALPATGSNSVETLYNNGSPLTSMTGFTSLQGWWKLDVGGSTITDYAGSNNGANNGASPVTSDVLATQPVNGVSTTLPSTALQQSDLQFDSPYSNYSLNFDGTGDYINIPDSTILKPQNLTVSFWVNAGTQSGNSKYFLEKGNFSYAVYTGATTTDLLFFIYDGSSYYVSNALTNALDNNWHHIAFTYDGSQIIGYKDGVANTPVSASATILYDTNPLRFFSRGPSSGNYPSGKMDETSIFNYALSSAQVLEIYNNGRPKDLSTFSGTAPISWWRLGENAYFDNNSFIVPNSISEAPNGTGSGTINTMISADAPGTYANGIGTNLDIVDRVGEAALSISNSQSYNMIPSDKSPYVPQYVGNQIANNFSMTFDGVDDFFDLNSLDQAILNGSFTVCFWLNKTAKVGVLNNDRIIDLTVSPSTSLQIITDAATNKFGVNFKQNGSHWIAQKVFNNWNTVTGSWHHIALTWDGSSYKYYFDGSSVATTGSSPIGIGGTGFYLGKRADGVASTRLKGGLDEVAIFDTALNAGQIYNDIYQPTATGTNQTADLVNNPNLPNTVAWYRMGD